MVADSTLGPAGVWAAGIQVEAAANPKESSPWLPAPASTGLHADLSAGIRTREKHERTTNYVLRARGGAYTCTPGSSLFRVRFLLSNTDATLGQRRDAQEPTDRFEFLL